MESDVAAFRAARPELDSCSVDSTKGRCHSVALELAAFCERDHTAVAVEGIGLRDELPGDAHSEWRRFSGRDQRFLYHVVVRVGRQTVDLTGAQFGARYAAVIGSWADFASRWMKIRAIAAEAAYGSGPWRRTRRTRARAHARRRG